MFGDVGGDSMTQAGDGDSDGWSGSLLTAATVAGPCAVGGWLQSGPQA